MTKKDYVGKICPFCKTEIKYDDDVVLCSKCGMPHHKECWIENQGCTTFGCTGTIEGVDDRPHGTTNGIPPVPPFTPVTNYTSSAANSAIDTAATAMGNTPTSTAATTSTSSEGEIYCHKCGTKLSPENAFCYNCGTKVEVAAPTPESDPAPSYNATPNQNTQYYTPNQNTQYYTPQNSNPYANNYGQSQGGSYFNENDREYATYIKVKPEHYIPIFNQMKATGNSVSWNWCAFLVAPYWLIYRKMYAYGAGVLAVQFLVNFLSSGIASFIGLAIAVVFGLLGNYIYFTTINKHIATGNGLQEPYKSQHVMRNSGVNGTATVLTIIGYVIFVSFVSYFTYW